MEQEALISGFCENCVCHGFYHIGNKEGVCVACGCYEYVQDEDSELYERLSPFLVKEVTEISLENIPEEVEEVRQELVQIIETPKGPKIFIGKVSRQCPYCGEIKLYKEFVEPDDPNAECNYCLQEQVEMALLEEEREYDESYDDYYDSDYNPYDDYDERQTFIDDVLRELDE